MYIRCNRRGLLRPDEEGVSCLSFKAIGNVVAQYFLHLHHCGVVIVDEEGAEYSNVEQVNLAALVAARGLIGEDALNGIMALNARIDIADSSGRIVGGVKFKDAIAVIE